MTVWSDSEYTDVDAEGGLVLDEELALDVQELTQGTVLTIMKGGSSRGRFDKLPENRAWLTGHLFGGVVSGRSRDADRHARGAALGAARAKPMGRLGVCGAGRADA